MKEATEYLKHLKECIERSEKPMTVKAYRVLEVSLAQPASFNFMEEKKLVEFLKDKMHLMVVFDDAGTALIHIPVSLMEEALNTVGITLETRAYLTRDVDFAKERHAQHIQYVVVGE